MRIGLDRVTWNDMIRHGQPFILEIGHGVFTFLAVKAFLVHFTSFLPTGTFLALLFLLGKQHFNWDELSRL